MDQIRADTPAPIKANLMTEQLSVQMSWGNGVCTRAGSPGDQQSRELGPLAARRSRAMMRANAWGHDELRVLLRWSQISSVDCIAESAISPLEHFSSNLASKSAAQAGSRSFQVRSRGVNFRLTRGTAAILKMQTRRRCCVRHSSPGMTLTSRMYLRNPLRNKM